MHKYCRSSTKQSCSVQSINGSTLSSVNTNNVLANKHNMNNVFNTRNTMKCKRSQSIQNNAFPLPLRSYIQHRRVPTTITANYTSSLTQSSLVECKSYLTRVYCAAALVSTKFARCENGNICNNNNNNNIDLSRTNNVTNATPLLHSQSNLVCNNAQSNLHVTHASSSSSFRSSPSPTPSSPLISTTQNNFNQYNICSSKSLIT